MLCEHSFSQELDTLTMDSLSVDSLLLDSIKKPPPHYIGTYVFGETRYSLHFESYNFALSFGFGIEFNNLITWFSVTNFSGLSKEFVIFPRSFILDYRCEGVSIGYRIFKNETMKFSLLASYHLGDMIWEEIEPSRKFQRDKFSISSISAKVDLDIIRYVKPYLILGYHRTK